MNIIKYRNWFFALSLAIIIPGLVALKIWGLTLGIDFVGGTLWELKFEKPVEVQQVRDVLTREGGEVAQAAATSQNSVLVRLKISDEDKIRDLRAKLVEPLGGFSEIRLETVGPTISRELTQKAFVAVGLSILAIVAYVTWAFRQVPRPASPWSFGICTIIALCHDVLVVVGVFAIGGHFLGWEVDLLFVTALLTVLGFSVHDTIVVFDRIRENLKKLDLPFPETVNYSLVQTMGRSLNTSLTVVFMLLALLLFGGASIKTFVIALLVGVVSGTYSSLFNAAPLLVVWEKIRIKN